MRALSVRKCTAKRKWMGIWMYIMSEKFSRRWMQRDPSPELCSAGKPDLWSSVVWGAQLLPN